MDLTVARSFSHYLVVSDLALVRVERRSEEELRQASTILLLVGGLLGPPLAALAEWIGLPGGPARLYLPRRATPALAEMPNVFTCWSADVPPELAEAPNWPRVEPFRPVTFYPKSLIEKVTLTRWGTLALTLRREAAREVQLPLPFLGRRKVVEHLRRAGYSVQPSTN